MRRSKADLTPEQRANKAVELGRQIAADLGSKPMRPEDLYDDETGLRGQVGVAPRVF